MQTYVMHDVGPTVDQRWADVSMFTGYGHLTVASRPPYPQLKALRLNQCAKILSCSEIPS